MTPQSRALAPAAWITLERETPSWWKPQGPWLLQETGCEPVLTFDPYEVDAWTRERGIVCWTLGAYLYFEWALQAARQEGDRQ